MSQIVVLVEEPSADIIVRGVAEKLGLLPRLIPISHEGKGDLEISIPRKLSRWRAPKPARFIVLRDNDRANCSETKNRLLRLIPQDANNRTRIRIVMQELEAWYFGDLPALERAGLLDTGQAESLSRKAKYRNPDDIANPKLELRKLIAISGQLLIAREVAPHLDIENNRSSSFKHFVAAMRWAAVGDS